jgi:hypothetical protein
MLQSYKDPVVAAVWNHLAAEPTLTSVTDSDPRQNALVLSLKLVDNSRIAQYNYVKTDGNASSLLKRVEDR